MLEFLIQFLPLIFLCSAIGVILLNFDSIGIYIVYLISMITQPKEIISASNNLIPQPVQKAEEKPKSVNLLVRIWTLFKVLFLPDLDFDALLHRNQNSQLDSSIDLFSQKTREAVSQYKLKTYSVSQDPKSTNFRYSYQSDTKDLHPPKPNKTRSGLSNIFSNHAPTKDSINARAEQNESLGIQYYSSNEEPLAEHRTAKTVYPNPYQSLNDNSHSEQLIEIRSEQKHLSADPNTLLQKNTQNGLIIDNLEKISLTTNSDKSIQNLPIQYVNVAAPTISPFKFIGDFIGLITKMITTLVLSLPLVVIFGSFILFLYTNNWKFTNITQYPKWVTSSLENLVRNNIVDKINNR